MKKIIQIICLAVVLLGFSTQSAQAKFKYKKELKKYTKSAEMYQRQDFHANIIWKVTYQAPEFLQAKAKKIAKTYKLSAQEEADIYAKQKQQFGKSVNFFVSFYSYDRNTTNLSVKDNKWKLYLVKDGKRFEPKHIREKSNLSPIEKSLFPYVDHWSKAYYVSFDLETISYPFELQVMSPEGHSKLLWK